MEPTSPSVLEFSRRKRMFFLRGILPMLFILLSSILMMAWALPKNNPYILLSNVLVFIAGVWYVKAAKRYYRCPVCEKVVVPTKDDGTPSEISFGIAYQPKVCPYCAAALS